MALPHIFLYTSKDKSPLKNSTYSNIHCIYKNGNFSGFFGRVRYVAYKVVGNVLRLSMRPFLSKDFLKLLRSNEPIIVFDSSLTMSTLRLLKKRKNNVFIYFWNRINKGNLKYLKSDIPVFSYSRFDCNKFGLNYVEYFYCPRNPKVTPIRWDVLFLGMPKDREWKLKVLADLFDKYSVSYRFLVPGSADIRMQLDEPLDYNEYLDLVDESYCLVDVNGRSFTSNGGFTQRVMECIFYDRALLSDNTSVLSDFFYDSEKTLFLDFENLDEQKIVSFVKNHKCIKYSEDIKRHYSIDKFVETICNFEK